MTSPSTAEQDQETCGWNVDFSPHTDCMVASDRCDQLRGEVLDYTNHPRVCVDWCDAAAYCRAVGKRLCGAIGGGSSLPQDYANAKLNQWYTACSVNGTRDIPTVASSDHYYSFLAYGGECNLSGFSYCTAPVASDSRCQGVAPYAGVYDLLGNVQEWVDNCESADSHAHCYVRGGSFQSETAKYVDCVGTESPINHNPDRTTADIDIGFRCCAD
jgi:formylglycine-generating enzyme required for sulfatase activity